QCRLGQAHICQNLRIVGIDQDGAFADFVRIPASNIIKLDPSIPEHYGAILDPLGNAVHTVLAGPIAGQTVLVTGCGPIGLMSIAVAKACGSSTVFATETNDARRVMAKKMGADVVINPAAEDAVKRILGETYGTGVDALLEMSGNPQAIQQGFKALRAGGRASLLGIPTENVPLDLVNDLIFKGSTVQGIYGRRMYETWVQMTALLKAGRLIAPPHVHHLDDEAWYVLEGAMCVQMGERVVEAQAGSGVLVPRKTPHTYWNPGPGPTRYLLIMTANIYQLIQDIHAMNERT